MITFTKIKTKFITESELLLERYTKFFDEKLNTTILVGLLGGLILGVGFLMDASADFSSNLKASLIETKYEKSLKLEGNIITINGKKYLLKLEKIK